MQKKKYLIDINFNKIYWKQKTQHQAPGVDNVKIKTFSTPIGDTKDTVQNMKPPLP